MAQIQVLKEGLFQCLDLLVTSPVGLNSQSLLGKLYLVTHSSGTGQGPQPWSPHLTLAILSLEALQLCPSPQPVPTGAYWGFISHASSIPGPSQM